MTGGYRLPTKYVVHTVGPVFRDGRSGESELLRSCYVESLKLAADASLESIAFPCISTGVYGYPKDEACAIAVGTVAESLDRHEFPKQVVFCCYGGDDAALYRRRLSRQGPS